MFEISTDLRQKVVKDITSNRTVLWYCDMRYIWCKKSYKLCHNKQILCYSIKEKYDLIVNAQCLYVPYNILNLTGNSLYNYVQQFRVQPHSLSQRKTAKRIAYSPRYKRKIIDFQVYVLDFSALRSQPFLADQIQQRIK